VRGDTIAEDDETFFVNLSSPANVTIADGQGMGTILNDDTPAARVFVSVTGSDANDCRNTSTPCRTFDGALPQVANGGEVIVLSTGSYAGATITKGVKINAPAGVVAFAASPVTVNAGPADVVVVRGLTIKALTPGTGSGIVFNAGAALFVENTVIDGWDRGVDFAGNGYLFVTDSSIRNSGTTGIRVAPPGVGLAAVDRSRIERTTGGCGIEVFAGGEAALNSSVASGNSKGVCASGGEVSVHGSALAGNSSSGLTSTAGNARITRSLLTGNGIGLHHVGGTLESLGNNLVRGNGTETSGLISPLAGQ
jgi:hypothetical protein